jgi:hypothetical protein
MASDTEARLDASRRLIDEALRQPEHQHVKTLVGGWSLPGAVLVAIKEFCKNSPSSEMMTSRLRTF